MNDSTRPHDCTMIGGLFQALPEAIILCDRELRVWLCNRAACELLRVDDPDHSGKRVDELLGIFVPVELLSAGARTVREWSARVGTGFARRSVQIKAVTLDGGVGWALFLRSVGASEDVPPFVGRSAIAQELLEFVSRVAASRIGSVLLEGETGTGKEVIARRLHALSARSRNRFVAVNCAALPEGLLESELFGYEKGAFTDARTSKQGLVQAANGGTLFLDEVAELPLSIQAKLLRVLEERVVRRLGGVEDIRVDLQVIAATNCDLMQAIEARQFRADLYYRLNIVQISIPPLRDRVEDVEDLALHFLDHFSRVHMLDVRGLHPRALSLLKLHPWPGNVRELRNVIERAVLIETSRIVQPASIRLQPVGDIRTIGDARRKPSGPDLSLHDTEKRIIAAALTKACGNQTRAAKLLGIGRFSLRYRMRKYGLM